MTERPIIFNGEMVRAIRAGRKTQTRRVVKQLGIDQPDSSYAKQLDFEKSIDGGREGFTPVLLAGCPFGQIGDRIWVRETWRAESRYDKLSPSKIPDGALIWYEADGVAPANFGRLRPSIHMPYRFHRTDLILSNVRVERLQELAFSFDDLLAEGMIYDADDPMIGPCDGDATLNLLDKWLDIWESIYGAESWDANPYVWVVEFKVVA